MVIFHWNFHGAVMLNYHTYPIQILQSTTGPQVVLLRCEELTLWAKARPRGSRAGAHLIFTSLLASAASFRPKQHHKTHQVFNQWLWIWAVAAWSCQHYSTNSIISTCYCFSCATVSFLTVPPDKYVSDENHVILLTCPCGDLDARHVAADILAAIYVTAKYFWS